MPLADIPPPPEGGYFPIYRPMQQTATKSACIARYLYKIQEPIIPGPPKQQQLFTSNKTDRKIGTQLSEDVL
jgi:hypothetical protein